MALLNAKVQELEQQYKEANDDKEAAIRESERCQRKLELANRLINALASEGERWALTVEQLRKSYEVLTGELNRKGVGCKLCCCCCSRRCPDRACLLARFQTMPSIPNRLPQSLHSAPPPPQAICFLLRPLCRMPAPSPPSSARS